MSEPTVSYSQKPLVCPESFEPSFAGDLPGIYLDGLSKGIHGNAERTKIDRIMREQLECDGIDVIEIAAADLIDPEAMKRHLKRIAVKLRRPDLRDR